MLAAALETAFDPKKSGACIALDQAARESASAWLPPGMGFVGGPADGSAADQFGGDDHIDADAENGDAPEIDGMATDLPAFLTEDEPSDVALNGACAP